MQDYKPLSGEEVEIQRLNDLVQLTNRTGANTGARIHNFLMFPLLSNQYFI